jgi:hypothetical protein
LVKDCSIDMNGLNTKVDVNIIPLGSYDCLIHMERLEKHNVFLYFYNNTTNVINEGGQQGKIQGILRVVAIIEISTI